MPELPEVETVRNVLKQDLIGRKIVKIDILYKDIFQNIEFVDKLISKEFKDIKRLGKYLIFIFTDETYLLSHLRMEGKYYYLNKYEKNKHMHVFFLLDNEYTLIYQDTRKFGRMKYYESYNQLLEDINLGVDANLETDYIKIYTLINKKRKTIKEVLLDQSIIAGLGNIYVDEVLYQSGINPHEIANNISVNDVKNILENSKKILNKAIIEKGCTIRSYTSSLGIIGNYQKFLVCHNKDYCKYNHKILKSKISGRGTYYCPICQKKKRKIIIGVTGNICCGKSTVCKYLERIGFNIIYLDKYVKDVLYQNKDIIKLIKDNFNVVKNSAIDIKLLREIVFNDVEQLNKLNDLIHPYVKDYLINLIEKSNFLIVEIPLLYELELRDYFTDVVVITSSIDKRITRLMNRNNYSYEFAKKIIYIQKEVIPTNNDYVIENINENDTYKLIENILDDIYKK